MNTKLVTISLIVLASLGIAYVYASPYISTYTPTIPVVFAQDTSSSTSEITNVVLEWMPLIIVFAMLGMVLGMLKKFGKI
jgi:hypothetical protein